MGAAMIKVTVGRAGHGAANVAYITRLSALEPEEHRREMEGAGVPRHGPRERLPRHELRQERLAGGPKEGARDSRGE